MREPIGSSSSPSDAPLDTLPCPAEKELTAACLRTTSFYGAVIGAVFGAGSACVALSQPRILDPENITSNLPYVIVVSLLATAGGALAGLPCGTMARQMGSRIRTVGGWTLAGAAGMLPMVIFLCGLVIGTMGLEHSADAWLEFGQLIGAAVLAAGVCGMIVGLGVREGRSPLPAVGRLIRAIDAATAANPKHFGLGPTEITPARAPEATGAEVIPEEHLGWESPCRQQARNS